MTSGHSMGGYIATDYALTYPHRVTRLILCSPFGFNLPDPAHELFPRRKHLPWYVKAIVPLAGLAGPMTFVRWLGPFGKRAVGLRARYDIGRYDFPDRRVAEYVYHLIVSCVTGQNAFLQLTKQPGGWANIGFAQQPLIDDIARLANAFPVTLIYGEADIMPPASGADIVKRLAPGQTDYHIIKDGCGHHPYATHANEFHRIVLNGGSGAKYAAASTAAATDATGTAAASANGHAKKNK